MRNFIFLATVALLSGSGGAASARCVTPSALAALGKSAAGALRCRERRLHLGSSSRCATTPPPSCGVAFVDDVLALAFGDVTTLPPGPRRRCQDAIVRGTRAFVGRRLLERAAGSRRQGRSRRAFAGVAKKCAVVADETPSGIAPGVGGACAAAVADVGTTTVDARRLAGCLRPAAERLVDGVAPQALQPSVLVVLTDDQRWDALDVMPTVTRDLVGRGVSFPDSFVTTSLCCPSRASLYSGEYAHHHGVLSNMGPNGGAPAFNDASTLPVWLSGAGYATALFGKYMNGNYRIAPRVPPGWSEWQTFVEDGDEGVGDRVYYDYTLNENGTLVPYGHTAADYSTDLLAARTLRFINEKADAPFFAVYAPFAPHQPAVPARRHDGIFAKIEPWRPPNWCEADVSDKPVWVQFMAAITTTEGIAKTDALRARQLETLLAVDEAVATMLATLEKLGLTDQTLVVFTSDNGFMWREHWWTSKLAAYEESLRVPLVLRLPVLEPLPRSVAGMALNIDLAPTFVQLAGLPIPGTVDGASLLGLLAGAPWRTDFLFENWGGPVIRPNVGVRTDRWKLIVTTSDGFEELYDLATDPYELTSHAGDPAYADVQAALAARLAELRAE